MRGDLIMEKRFGCDVAEKEAKDFLDISDRYNALERLVMIIAKNNEIIKEDSLLYTRLVEDYKETLKQHNQFWDIYLDKYGHLLDEKTQFSLDFKTNKIYITALGS